MTRKLSEFYSGDLRAALEVVEALPSSYSPPEAVSSAVRALRNAKTAEARAVYRLRIQNLLLSLPQGPEPQNEAPHG